MKILNIKKNKISQKARAKPLASHLGVGVSTIWRWAKEGKIKPYKISTGVTVFDVDEVMADLGLE